MARFASFVVLAITLVSSVAAFPAHASLAGLSIAERDEIISKLKPVMPQPPPPPLKFNGTKLVYDADHPWQAPRPGDQRGPCPGMNTLASHGWLPHNGVADPVQFINACQDAYNTESGLARRFAYSALLADGNLVTNLLSIGHKSPLTGPDPDAPATIAGLSFHGPFEGDASITRNDKFFGDNFSFNQTLWEELLEYANKYGAGKYNHTVAGEIRYKRIQDSIANNPQFELRNNRYFAAYQETLLAANLFLDGRVTDGQLDLGQARSFFADMRFPDDFHRAAKPMGVEGIEYITKLHPMEPGYNANGVNSYTVDPNSPSFTNDPNNCKLYKWFVEQVVVPAYPEPKGVLRRNLNINLQYYYDTFVGCEQLFPYGKPGDKGYSG